MNYPSPDPFVTFRGVVDDRVLDDERLTIEFRLSLAVAVAGGHITLTEAVERVQTRLAEESWEEGEHQGPPEVPMAEGGKNVPPPSSEEGSAPTPLDPSSADSEAADFTTAGEVVTENSEGAAATGPVQAAPDEPGDVPVGAPTPAEYEIAVEEPVTPEQLKALPLTTAAALLPPEEEEEEEETPPPPGTEPPPPGEAYGRFLVQKNAYGPGTERVLVLFGEVYEPVGIWLHNEHPSLTPDGVYTLLTEMGLPPVHAEPFRRHRAMAAPVEIEEGSALAQLQQQEERHLEVKDSFSKAFVEAQKRKGKR